MSKRIRNILLRCILNSCAKISVEAELVLDDGSKGIASVPVAIKAGRREKSRSNLPTQGWLGFADNVKQITESLKTLTLKDQDQFDDYLNNQFFFFLHLFGDSFCALVQCFNIMVLFEEHQFHQSFGIRITPNCAPTATLSGKSPATSTGVASVATS